MAFPSFETEWHNNKDKIREIFNKKYLPEINNGNLKEIVISDNHTDLRNKGLPFCTKSQYVVYEKDGEYKAGAHQYLKPDGTLGASGLPDPNRIVIQEKIIAYKEN